MRLVHGFTLSVVLMHMLNILGACSQVHPSPCANPGAGHTKGFCHVCVCNLSEKAWVTPATAGPASNCTVLQLQLQHYSEDHGCMARICSYSDSTSRSCGVAITQLCMMPLWKIKQPLPGSLRGSVSSCDSCYVFLLHLTGLGSLRLAHALSMWRPRASCSQGCFKFADASCTVQAGAIRWHMSSSHSTRPL